MDATRDEVLRERVHRAAAALAELQVHLLWTREALAPGGVDAYKVDSMLAAVDPLRVVIGEFIEAAIGLEQE